MRFVPRVFFQLRLNTKAIATARRSGHTLNTLTLLDTPLRIDAENQLDADLFYRYQQNLQEFFDGAAARKRTPNFRPRTEFRVVSDELRALNDAPARARQAAATEPVAWRRQPPRGWVCTRAERSAGAS